MEAIEQIAHKPSASSDSCCKPMIRSEPQYDQYDAGSVPI